MGRFRPALVFLALASEGLPAPLLVLLLSPLLLFELTLLLPLPAFLLLLLLLLPPVLGLLILLSLPLVA
jgi:hypothetical protein